MLKLVEKPEPKSLSCQRTPDMWTPLKKMDDPSLIIGLRFTCDKCGYVGQAVWGPLQDLPSLANLAESAFSADFEGSQPHCPWLMGEDVAVSSAPEEDHAEASPREVDYFAGRYGDFG